MTAKPTYEELEQRIRELEHVDDEYKKTVDEVIKFKTISDSAVQGNAISDLHGNLIYVNEYFAQIHGYTSDELTGQNLSVFHNETQLDAVSAINESLKKDGKYSQVEVSHIHKDGSVIPMLMSGVLIKDSNGDPQYLAATAIDITEKKQAEVELQRSQAQLLRSQYIAKMGDFTWDIASGTATWSDGMHHLLKYSTDETIDYQKVNADIHHPDDLERITRWLQDGINSGEEYLQSNEYRLIAKDGEVIHVQTNGRFEFQDGKAVKLLGTCIDITKLKQAEEKSKQNESNLNRMFQFTDYMVCITDLQTARFTKISPAFSRHLGWSEEELLSKPIQEFLHPDDVKKTTDVIKKQMDQGDDVLQFENRYLTINGDFRWFEWAAKTIPGEGITYAAAYDITERKRAEKQLKESEFRYRRFFENSPYGIVICQLIRNDNGEVTDFIHLQGNPAIIAETGFDLKNIVGKNASEIGSPEEIAEPIKMYANVVETGIPVSFQQYFPVYDRTLEVTAFCLHGDTFIMNFIDITEKRRAEEEFKESNALLSSVIESPQNVIIFALDKNFNYLSFNKAHVQEMKRVYGVDIEVGTNTLTHISREDDRKAIEKNYKRVLNGERFTIVQEYGKEEARSWYELIFNPIIDDADQVTGLTVFVTDITNRKRTEEEKLSLERQVQHAQKLESLGVLAGGIAHDFNNLLMTILGNADLAQDELSPMSPAQEYLREIEKSCKCAADLAKQMLAYSGKGRFVVESIDIGEFVEEMAHLLEVSISKKALLKYNLAENLPTIAGDVTQIRQIIMNLIINASEAIGDESGVIALSTGAKDCDRAYLDNVNENLLASSDEPLTEGIYTYIEVTDTGCGMDAGTIKKIFDPFFTTKFTGRGLGMSAVLGIIRGHGGAIKISSEVGKGTTFRILFPANTQVANDPVPKGDSYVEGKNWQGSGTVLVADDEEMVCAVAKRMLERMGFKVLTALDGREALKSFCAHTEEIDLVLLDLTMPHLDGLEVFQEMRRIQPGVRVILCSGYNEKDATQHFVGKGLAGFIQKPFQRAQLQEKLRYLLEVKVR